LASYEYACTIFGVSVRSQSGPQEFAEVFMSKKTAVAAIVLGVAFNNYVYLHDLILQKYEGGLIDLGTKSAVIVILAGVRALARGQSDLR
jgi:hypothetical protein